MPGTSRSANALQREALRLISLIIPELHAVQVEGGRVRFEADVSLDLAEDLCAFASSVEDDEDDGSDEPDLRRLPRTLAELEAPGDATVPASSPRLGYSVLDPSVLASTEAGALAVARLWPDLMLPPARAA